MAPSCRASSERLSALVGVPVEQARPRELIALGDIGFSEDELPRLDPYLPAAVGLALGGAGVGTVINLQPAPPRRRRLEPTSEGLSGSRRGGDRSGRAARRLDVYGAPERFARQVTTLRPCKRRRPSCKQQLAALAPVLHQQSQIDTITGQITTLLATDISWEKMIKRITSDLPAGISLTSFSAASTPPAPVAPVVPPVAATDTGGSSTPTTTATPTTLAAPAADG